MIREAVRVVARLRSAHRPFQIEIARCKERNPAPRRARGSVAEISRRLMPALQRLIGLSLGSTGPLLAELRRVRDRLLRRKQARRDVCPINSSYREREITCQLNNSAAMTLIAHAKL